MDHATCLPGHRPFAPAAARRGGGRAGTAVLPPYVSGRVPGAPR
jgi:hypothetical protein